MQLTIHIARTIIRCAVYSVGEALPLHPNRFPTPRKQPNSSTPSVFEAVKAQLYSTGTVYAVALAHIKEVSLAKPQYTYQLRTTYIISCLYKVK
jgi:hypothetical protein